MSTTTKLGLGTGAGLIALILAAGQFTWEKSEENGLYFAFDSHLSIPLIVFLGFLLIFAGALIYDSVTSN